MRQLGRTIYINSPFAYIMKEGDDLKITEKREEVGRFPIRNLENVVTFTAAGITPEAMRLCIDNGVGIAIMSPRGRFIASVNGQPEGNVLLRRTQYRIADDEEKSLKFSRNMILGKIGNGRRMLLQSGKYNYAAKSEITEAAESMKGSMEAVLTVNSADTLRGLEGDAARVYFGVLGKLVTRNPEQFNFEGRNRRPPRDRMNALLSFTYAVAGNEVRSALAAVGLDPYVGFMHTDRPGRASLALDVLEELRPAVDRFVLTLVNRLEIGPDDFSECEDGAVMMTEEGRKKLLTKWEQWRQEVIVHPFTKESMERGLVPLMQARLLASSLRGDLNGYPPFMM